MRGRHSARRAASALGILLLAAGRAGAAPVCPPMPAPTVTAIPRYGAAPSILVQWTDTPAETAYELWRGANGAALTKLVDLAANVVSYRDAAVDTASSYHYQVKSCIGLVCPVLGDFTTSVTVVWPISGGHELLHGFNEVLAWAGIRGGDGVTAGFHDGVDLNRTTAGATAGDNLSAPRGGVVNTTIDSMTADDSYIAVQVDIGVDAMGNPMIEFDGFNHTANDPTNDRVVCQGQVVAPGQKLGQIGTRQFPGDFSDHTHTQVMVGSAFMSSARHFLTIFTQNADRDPLGNSPALFDENGDGKNVLFRDHNEMDKTKYLDYDHDTKPLKGDVDIHVEVTDQQGTNPRLAPIDVGYWIEGPRGPTDDLDDVASAATPYKLYDFRTNYFGLGTATDCSLVSDIQDPGNSGCKGLTDCTTFPGVACNSVIKEGATNFPWPVLHHFIVTHAKGTDGSRANVDGTQYWRTKAKEDNAATPMPANYSGKPEATKATDARFPDGDYKIHVIASDLVHANVDLVIDKIRLENYSPYIMEVAVYGDLDDNVGTQIGPDYPGCETELYNYKSGNPPAPYPGASYLAESERDTFAQSNRRLCMRVRFSEQMDKSFPGFKVELDPQGSAGAPPLAFAGAFSKTNNPDDTWKGQLFLPADPSGNSDATMADHAKDAVVRIVARDLKDRDAAQRGLDKDGDGMPEANATDENHMIKLDLSAPTSTIDKTP